jgi:hypothetical protein
VIELPASIFERSAPETFGLGLGLGRSLPVAAAIARGAASDLEPDDPSRAWVDVATVVGVLDTIGHFLKG